MKRIFILSLACLVCLSACDKNKTPAPQITAEAKKTISKNPLHSWNDGPVKEAILEFVQKTIDPQSPQYVKPSARIAVFDGAGTLWVEKPIPLQWYFALEQYRLMFQNKEGLEITPLRQAIFDEDWERFGKLTADEYWEVALSTHANLSFEELYKKANEWVQSTDHRRFERPYAMLVYQPMRELINYLRYKHFQVYLCTDEGLDTMRAYSEDLFGIPPQNVIGTTLVYDFDENNKKVDRLPKAGTINQGTEKPKNLRLHIGRVPIFAAGNSDEDLEMLEWVSQNQRNAFVLIVKHNDASREYDYSAKELEYVAKQKGWHVVGIEEGFSKLFN